VCCRTVVVLLAGIRIYVGNTRAFWERVNVELQGMWRERENNICGSVCLHFEMITR
jgi:hypothetical protein